MSPFSDYGIYGSDTLKETFSEGALDAREIKAFSDNVVVRSTLSYLSPSAAEPARRSSKDQPLTAVMTRSLVLLPCTPYSRPRMTDSRMSVFPDRQGAFQRARAAGQGRSTSQTAGGWSPRTWMPEARRAGRT